MSRSTSVITVAAGRPLLEILNLCYEASRSVLLKGGTGVGKSTLLESFAQRKKIGFICRDLSLMEPPDLVGLPKIQNGMTSFLAPEFLPRKGKGIFDLEEVNRAPEYMRAPCLQLLTARCLNDYRLPEGWLPVACINPAEDGYDAAELDPALLTRFVQINVVPSREEWVAWARENKIHDQVIAYVESDPGVFDSPLSNPRSWSYVSDLLLADLKLSTDPALLRAAVAGCVGPERATAFFGFVKNGVRPLRADEILFAYRSRRKVLQSWVADGKLDLVEATMLNVEKYLQARSDFQSVQDQPSAWKSLGRFLSDLPGDLRARAEEFFGERQYDLPA
jgi:hypothetical protein